MDRILGFDAQTLIAILFQLFNTLLLSGVLGFLLYKPVKEFMQKRSDRIKAEIASAETALKESNQLKELYEKKLKEIDKERIEILEAARLTAFNKENEIVAEAQKEADVIKSRALLDVEREKQKAADEMKKQMVEISALMASKFVKANMDDKAQSALLDSVIAELGDVKWLS